MYLVESKWYSVSYVKGWWKMLVGEIIGRLNEGDSMASIGKLIGVSHGKVVKAKLEKLGVTKDGELWVLGEGVEEGILHQELSFKSQEGSAPAPTPKVQAEKKPQLKKPSEGLTDDLSKEDIETLKEMIRTYRVGGNEGESGLSVYDYLLAIERTSDKVKRTPMIESKVADKLDSMSDKYRISKEDVFMIAINLMYERFGSSE